MGFEKAEGSLLRNDVHTKPVRYLKDYPKLDLSSLNISWDVSIDGGTVSESIAVDITQPDLQTVIYSKAEDWQYEQEWRVLVADGGKLSPYPGPLKRIIFGVRCEPDSRKKVREAVLESSAGMTQFAEIEYTKGSFALQIRDLDA
jgi:hypothetical protein